MYPEQPGGQGPANNPYQFIIEPSKPQRRGLLPSFGGGNNHSFLLRIGLIVGGAIIFMIVTAIVVNVFFSGKSNLEDLVGLTQQETELVRISGQQQQAKLGDQGIKNAAATTQTTLESHLQTWLAELKQRGRTVGDKELDLKLNTATDTTLTTAEQANTLDTVFRDELRRELTAYATELKTAYDHTSRPAEQKILERHYDETQLLIKLLESQ